MGSSKDRPIERVVIKLWEHVKRNGRRASGGVRGFSRGDEMKRERACGGLMAALLCLSFNI